MRLRLLIALATVFLLASLPALAEALRCRENFDFCVEVDGAYPGDARFYQSDSRGKFYIDIPKCRSGLLMDLSLRKIVSVPRTLVTALPDGLEVNDSPPADAASYAFSVDGPVIEFQAESRKVRILPVTSRPPIVGQVTIDYLIADRPEYRAGMKAYTPDAASVAAIGKYPKPVELEAYFATWCPHCKEFMPKFLRVIQDAKNPKIRLNLVGVPRGFTTTDGPWKEKGLTGIPTIIVKIDGREITRLGAAPGPGPEVELAGILQAVR
ncbi:MAG TPA: thioredoxin family protein [Candidatus Polarisedimenticolia bacterium]|nr:thioredoxin family protein [Candidatus Polarisedimenticolia bacterium]